LHFLFVVVVVGLFDAAAQVVQHVLVLEGIVVGEVVVAEAVATLAVGGAFMLVALVLELLAVVSILLGIVVAAAVHAASILNNLVLASLDLLRKGGALALAPQVLRLHGAAAELPELLMRALDIRRVTIRVGLPVLKGRLVVAAPQLFLLSLTSASSSSFLLLAELLLGFVLAVVCQLGELENRLALLRGVVLLARRDHGLRLDALGLRGIIS